jgi:hypothetical protein
LRDRFTANNSEPMSLVPQQFSAFLEHGDLQMARVTIDLGTERSDG